MSYTLRLQCGCVVYVARNPHTGVAHTRVIETRGAGCGVRRHEVGLRLGVWDMLPARASRSDAEREIIIEWM
jgi:hypothetical protein